MKATLSALLGLAAIGQCAVPDRTTNDVVVTKRMAYAMLNGARFVGDEEELPEIPENINPPSCAPSNKILAALDWMYVPNSSKGKDVWFGLVLNPERNWSGPQSSCEAIGSGIHIASVMNSNEDKVLAKWSKNGKKKPWTG